MDITAKKVSQYAAIIVAVTGGGTLGIREYGLQSTEYALRQEEHIRELSKPIDLRSSTLRLPITIVTESRKVTTKHMC